MIDKPAQRAGRERKQNLHQNPLNVRGVDTPTTTPPSPNGTPTVTGALTKRHTDNDRGSPGGARTGNRPRTGPLFVIRRTHWGSARTARRPSPARPPPLRSACSDSSPISSSGRRPVLRKRARHGAKRLRPRALANLHPCLRNSPDPAHAPQCCRPGPYGTRPPVPYADTAPHPGERPAQRLPPTRTQLKTANHHTPTPPRNHHKPPTKSLEPCHAIKSCTDGEALGPTAVLLGTAHSCCPAGTNSGQAQKSLAPGGSCAVGWSV